MNKTNRAHLLTPPGVAAIAVVRLTGPGVSSFLAAHFSRPLAPGRCVHGELTDGTVTLDDPVIILLPDGGADISLHGGQWVVQSVLALAKKAGFELTDPPQAISLDAVEGVSLLEKEVNAHLPQARTELGVRVLLNQAAAWDQLIRRATPGPGERAQLARWLQKAEGIKSEIAAILADRSLHWLLNPPRVAIIGAPNVGKSTLANRLFSQERVITADLPGTTRDWVGEIANLDGLAVMLVDTPGIRQTDDPIESQAIARSGEQIQSADLVVVVLDSSRPLEGEQAAVLESWPDALRVANKTDSTATWDLALIGGVKTIATSGQGIDDLRQSIRARFSITPAFNERSPRWWTQRQKSILEESQGRVELISQLWGGQGPS